MMVRAYTLSHGERRTFPVIKDLMVDRSAFDRVIQSGGYVSTTTGGVEDANSLPIYKDLLMQYGCCRVYLLWCLCLPLCPKMLQGCTVAKVSHPSNLQKVK